MGILGLVTKGDLGQLDAQAAQILSQVQSGQKATSLQASEALGEAGQALCQHLNNTICGRREKDHHNAQNTAS